MINIINKTIEIEITTGDMISTHIIMTDIIIIEMIEADLEANNKTEMTEVGPEAWIIDMMIEVGREVKIIDKIIEIDQEVEATEEAEAGIIINEKLQLINFII